jgi:hypothetical protein
MASVKIEKNKIIFFTVKNGIKLIYICVTMIGQVVLSCLNRNSHIFLLTDRYKKKIFALDLDFFLKWRGI